MSSCYAAAFFACALTFAQRSFIAFEIFALPLADSTRFFARVMSRVAVFPRALAADCKPIKSCCSLANCFFTFFSSRLIAANMLMDPPQAIYMRRRVKPIPLGCPIQFVSRVRKRMSGHRVYRPQTASDLQLTEKARAGSVSE